MNHVTKRSELILLTQTTYDRKKVSGWTENVYDHPVSQLKLEYEFLGETLDMQPALIKRFLATQASQTAPAIIERQAQIRFSLPDRISVRSGKTNEAEIHLIPEKKRQQVIGSIIENLGHKDIRKLVRERLAELEISSDPAIALAARLIRLTIAGFMLNNMLPAGRDVIYTATEGDDIPNIPIESGQVSSSALTATTDAIVEEHQSIGRDELQSPFVPSARRFFLPQWVAFDGQGNMLVNSTGEAEAYLESMQRYLDILHTVVALAPYCVVDPTYQQKRYGILGQIVNQGRQLASYETKQIIDKIHARATIHELDRGLSLSLPFFDDQDLQMKMYNFDVIPAGRIMFLPAFVIRAARQEQAKVAQDTRLSASTRKHLLAELESIEQAFCG
jgi:hypothetical protein